MNEFKVLNGYEVKDEEARNMLSEIGTFTSDETLTGQKWIDDRPIYRKVMDLGAVADGVNLTKSVEHGITDFDFVTKLDGFIKARATGTGSHNIKPLPWVRTGEDKDLQVELSIDSTNVNIIVPSTSSAFTQMVAYVIIEYVKIESE